MNDLLLTGVKMLNSKIRQYLMTETKLNKDAVTTRIAVFYDQIVNEQNDVKIIDLESMYNGIKPIHAFDGSMDVETMEFDGYLYGFEMQTNAFDQSDDFLCFLSSSNRRFEWIAHIEFILNNNEFIKRNYSSKLKNKRSNMVSLDKNIKINQNECNKDRCTYALRLIALNKLYANNKNDIAEIIINRRIDILSIYDSYIHCAVEANHKESYLHTLMSQEYETKCKENEDCIHYQRYNAESNNVQNRNKYYQQYNNHNIEIIQFLDQIHCFLYHRNIKEDNSINCNTRKRRNSYKFIRDFGVAQNKKEKKENLQYFGGAMMNYWSFTSVHSEQSSDDLLIDDDYEKDGVCVIYRYQTLKEEVTQNIVCRLNEDDYNDIYKKAVKLLNTNYCRKNLKALSDHALNEKFKIAPDEFISINHIICILIYCNYFNVCSKWINFMRVNEKKENIKQQTVINESESMEMIDNYGEFAFFHRYLCELCQIYGQSMKENEYLYVMPTANVLFTEWNQMINFPISVTPPLDITQSFM